MIDPTEALVVEKVLREAAEAMPLRAIKYELEARADEFRRAAEDFMEAEGGGVIEQVSAVGRGMRVLHERFGWVRVIRRLARDGQVTLHLDSPDAPQGFYRNFLDDTSPVVVRL